MSNRIATIPAGATVKITKHAQSRWISRKFSGGLIDRLSSARFVSTTFIRQTHWHGKTLPYTRLKGIVGLREGDALFLCIKTPRIPEYVVVTVLKAAGLLHAPMVHSKGGAA